MEVAKKDKCLNCGNKNLENYCSHCGLKRVTSEDKKIGKFLTELFSSFFFADGKIFSTFRVILTKPGELTQTYISGNRKKYLAPLQLFFFANLLYFIFPLISTFNTNLSTQIKRLPYSSYVKEVVVNHISEKDIKYEDFRDTYEKQSSQNAKLLLVLLVVFQALSLKLLFIKSKTYYFYDFIAASAYFNAIYIIFLLILFPALVMFFGRFIQIDQLLLSDTWLSITFAAIIILYLSIFLKRAFNIGLGESFAKSILLMLFLIPSFILFRFILFWTTFWIVA